MRSWTVTSLFCCCVLWSAEWISHINAGQLTGSRQSYCVPTGFKLDDIRTHHTMHQMRAPAAEACVSTVSKLSSPYRRLIDGWLYIRCECRTYWAERGAGWTARRHLGHQQDFIMGRVQRVQLHSVGYLLLTCGTGPIYQARANKSPGYHILSERALLSCGAESLDRLSKRSRRCLIPRCRPHVSLFTCWDVVVGVVTAASLFHWSDPVRLDCFLLD